MQQVIDRVLAVGWVDHVVRAWFRFLERLGFQFAAAITYFSVLSMVQVLMVAFAAVGLVLTVLVPGALEEVKRWLTEAIAVGGLAQELNAIIEQAFASWSTVGLIGLLWALWTGQAWVANIRIALVTITRPLFDPPEDPPNPVRLVLANVATLFGLFALMLLIITMSTVATSARNLVADLTGLDQVAGGRELLSIVPLAGSFLASCVLFWFLYTVFPENRVPRRVRLQASLLGAVAMTILQVVAGVLLSVFSGNVTAAVFGSVIVVMLYFNILATIVLVVGAWIGTHPRYLEKATSVEAAEAGRADAAPGVGDGPVEGGASRWDPSAT